MTSSALSTGTGGVASAAAPWIERVARVGFAAKALLYAIVGGLALQAALGHGGKTTGTRGALREVIDKPFGKIILLVIAVGLLGYAAWRVVEGVADPERKGSDAKGIALRGSFIVRGIAHAILAVQALRVASSHGGGGEDGAAAKEATSRAMSLPHGEWVVLLLGAVIAGFGLYQLYRGIQAKLGKQLDFAGLRREAGPWAIVVSRFGIAARGVVFAMIGVLMMRAGRDENASESGGIGEALDALGDGANGWIILAVAAAGLVAYGAFEAIQARYRHIDANAAV